MELDITNTVVIINDDLSPQIFSMRPGKYLFDRYAYGREDSSKCLSISMIYTLCHESLKHTAVKTPPEYSKSNGGHSITLLIGNRTLHIPSSPHYGVGTHEDSKGRMDALVIRYEMMIYHMPPFLISDDTKTSRIAEYPVTGIAKTYG